MCPVATLCLSYGGQIYWQANGPDSYVTLPSSIICMFLLLLDFCDSGFI